MNEALYRTLSSVLGKVEILQDGFPPLAISHPVIAVHPETVEQVAEVLRIASAERAPVVPLGNGSALHRGNLPADAVLLLSTRRLSATIDYEPRDLTVIAQAGKPLSALQEELGRHGQFLALDPPNADRATLGGIVSTNASGPLRRAYGTPRDLTLGLKAVLADGTVVKGGGRTVKNVAGYDTTKLFVGSLGTLGVVVEAAFRLHPLPESEAGVLGAFETWEAVIQSANRLAHSELQPRVLELLNLNDASWAEDQAATFAPSVLVGFGGPEATVAYQVERAQSLLGETGARELWTFDAEGARNWRRRLGDALSAAYADENAVVCRIGTVMTETLATLEAATQLADTARIGVQCRCHYGNGVVFGVFRPVSSADDLGQLIERLRKEMATREGHVVVESAPGGVKRLLDVWGPPTGPLDLMRQLKERLDPDRLLNRGRFIWGV